MRIDSPSSRFADGWRFAFSILALVVIFRLPTLFTGFYNPDETCYATIGARILEGKLLYRDVIDHKPPLVYYLYSLFVLLGKNYAIYIAHAAMIFIVAATSIVLSSIAKLLASDRKIAVLAAVLYALGASLGKPNDVAAANSELIFNLPLALFVYFILRAKSERRNSFAFISAAGFMSGIAMLIKPQAVFAIPAVIIFLIYESRREILRGVLDSALVLFFAMAPAAAAAINLYYNGILGDAIYWGFTVNSLYMQGHESGIVLALRFVKQTSYMIFAEEGSLWFPLIFWIFLKEKGRPLLQGKGFLIYLWLIFSALASVPGLRFYGHYYLQMLPPLSIMAAAAILNLKNMIAWKKTAVAMMIILIAVPLVHSWIWAWPISKFRTAIESEENAELIEYLKNTTRPDQKIEVWGRFNGIPFLAGRENGSRFLNKNLLAGSFRREELVKMPNEHWRLYFYDLEKKRPEWFVDHAHVDMKDAPISTFPTLAAYIASNYDLIAEISGNRIYRRK